MKNLKSSVTRCAGAILLSLGLTNGASATLVTGTSGGQALSLDVGLLGIPALSIQTASAGGSYPADYTSGDTVLALDVGANASGGLAGEALLSIDAATGVTARVLEASASGSNTAVTGMSSVAGLNLFADLDASLFGVVPVGGADLGTSVDVLSSVSAIYDSPTGLQSFAQSVILGLNVNALVNLLGIDLGQAFVVADLSSDTVGFNFDVFGFLGLSDLADTLGLSLIANEMVDTCAPDASSSSCGVMTTALHLGVDLLNLDGGLASIDLMLGHSFAEATWEVPTPGTLLLFAAGLVLLATRFRPQAASLPH